MTNPIITSNCLVVQVSFQVNDRDVNWKPHEAWSQIKLI